MNSASAEGVARAADPVLAQTADSATLSPMEAALQRLTTSRLRLRGALVPATDDPATSGSGAEGSITRKVRAMWQQWRRRWQESPAVDIVMESVQNWWQHNPWRELATTMADEVSGLVAPAVRRRPWTAVLAAAGVGLALVTVRPWRWSPVAAQLRPLRHQAVNWIVGQALTAPLHNMFASLMAVVALNRKPGAPASGAEQGPDATEAAETAAAANPSPAV